MEWGEERKVYHLELLAEMLESEAETHLKGGREEKVQLGYFCCAKSTYTFTVWRLLKRDGVKTCHSKLDTLCRKLSSLCHWHIFRYSSRFYHLSALLPAFRTSSAVMWRHFISLPYRVKHSISILWRSLTLLRLTMALGWGFEWIFKSSKSQIVGFCVDNFDESDFFLPWVPQCKLISSILMIRTICLKCWKGQKSLEWTWLEGAS